MDSHNRVVPFCMNSNLLCPSLHITLLPFVVASHVGSSTFHSSPSLTSQKPPFSLSRHHPPKNRQPRTKAIISQHSKHTHNNSKQSSNPNKKKKEQKNPAEKKNLMKNRHLQDLNLRSRMKQISDGHSLSPGLTQSRAWKLSSGVRESGQRRRNIRVCRLNHSAKVSLMGEVGPILDYRVEFFERKRLWGLMLSTKYHLAPNPAVYLIHIQGDSSHHEPPPSSTFNPRNPIHLINPIILLFPHANANVHHHPPTIPTPNPTRKTRLPPPPTLQPRLPPPPPPPPPTPPPRLSAPHPPPAPKTRPLHASAGADGRGCGGVVAVW